MNVRRLEGSLLNFWVAKSAGLKILPEAPAQGSRHDPDSGYWHPLIFHPATDWSQAGPIVSNEWYVLEDILAEWFGPDWTSVQSFVDDPLKWFMRAYVASQFGDEVENITGAEASGRPGADMEPQPRFGALRALVKTQWRASRDATE